MRYLNMDHLREHKKQMLRQAARPMARARSDFKVMRTWNQALLYRKAIVLLAEQIAKP
jgi:membrane-bound lytic murein transglycosylase B